MSEEKPEEPKVEKAEGDDGGDAGEAKSATIKIKCQDGEVIEVDRKIACWSQIIKNNLEFEEDAGVESPIVLQNVSSRIFRKVFEYCEYHEANPSPESDKKEEKDEKKIEFEPWDLQYVDLDQPTLFELILAANYLDIKPLLDVTCKKVAKMIKDCNSAEEIRKLFNVKNDFTPEEEEEVRRENEWCLDK